MSEGQSRLSEICKGIIDQYFNCDMTKAEDEIAFWDSFKKFYKELSEGKSYNNLGDLLKMIGEIKVNIESLKQQAEVDTQRHLFEKALSERQTIGMAYLNFIHTVMTIKEKALLVENQPSMETKPGWLGLFLMKYYQVIATEGSLDDIINLMEGQLSTMDEAMIKGCFTRQKTRLNQIAKNINYLRGLNNGFPQDLKDKVSGIDIRISDLRSLYTKNIDLNEKADQILEVHEKLKEDLLCLYQETVKRSVT